MHKRDVTTVPHAALTDHRIVAAAGEPYPDAAFRLTTPSLPDLINLDAVPGDPNGSLQAETLLEVYAQVATSDPAIYEDRYLKLIDQVAKSNPDNLLVLWTLAKQALRQGDADGEATAIRYLERAVQLESTEPAVYLVLAQLLARANRLPASVEILKQGLRLSPYNPQFYELMVASYISMKKYENAVAAAQQGLQLFPEDSDLRSLLERAKSESNP
jgi:predicted Zn-dependent protease